MPAKVELSCPDCQSVLARVRRVRLAVGRPFEECPRCRTLVARPATNEWDLLEGHRKATWLLDRTVPLVLLALAPAGAYWWTSMRPGSGDVRVLAALVALGLALTLLGLGPTRSAIRRSRARMSDPMYRARLLEFGRRVRSES